MRERRRKVGNGSKFAGYGKMEGGFVGGGRVSFYSIGQNL